MEEASPSTKRLDDAVEIEESSAIGKTDTTINHVCGNDGSSLRSTTMSSSSIIKTQPITLENDNDDDDVVKSTQSSTKTETTSTETCSSDEKYGDSSTTATSETTTPSSLIDQIDDIRHSMQELHDSGQNHTYQWRLTQLITVRRMIQNHWDDCIHALHIDLHKCSTESIATELLQLQTELNMTIRHLRQWMKPKPIPSPMICIPSTTYIQSRPLLGPAVLIIGPSNYPISLLFHPAIGALAAGNPVVLKPSELAPTVSQLVSRIVAEYFPSVSKNHQNNTTTNRSNSTAMVCITGGIPETTQLLRYSWGRIFFTGSMSVGKIIAQSAAQTMTPITLECGGKSICYIDGTSTNTNDATVLQQITQRIIWSKTLNAGQTCAATDTVICDSATLVELLLPYFIDNITTMFGTDPRTTSDMGRIVTVQHTQRLIDMIVEVEDYIASSSSSEHDNPQQQQQQHQCRIVYGGSQHCNAQERYIVPTIIVNPPRHLRVMREEIFGPILPIITVNSRPEAIQYIRQMNTVTTPTPVGDSNSIVATTTATTTMTPLCLYVFTNSSTVLQQMIQQIPAGSVVWNDCLIHLSSPFIPFGGLGSSGYGGAYHGKYTFDLFTHPLPVMHRPYVWSIFPDWNVLRCHPFTPMKQFITLHVAMRLPAIPVLHVRFVSIVVVVLIAMLLGVWIGKNQLPQ